MSMTLTDRTVAFLGGGNMAEALIKGLLNRSILPPARVWVSDIDRSRLDRLREAYGVHGAESNEAAVRFADVVILAVKPQVMRDALGGVAALAEKPLWVSLAAGWTTERIESVLGGAPHVVRTMPNTPALVGEGIAGVCLGRHATEDDAATAEALLKAVGEVVRVDESQMDAVTAVSGSGPAYVFYLAEALLAGAESVGLPEAIARQLVNATIHGAARLALESGEAHHVLRQRVTSKGGTTAAALGVLEQAAVHRAFAEAVRAAHRRAGELARDAS